MMNENKHRPFKIFAQSVSLSQLLTALFLLVSVLVALVWLAPLSYRLERRPEIRDLSWSQAKIDNRSGLKEILRATLVKLRALKISPSSNTDEAQILTVTTPLDGSSDVVNLREPETFVYINYDWNIQLELPQSWEVVSPKNEKIVLTEASGDLTVSLTRDLIGVNGSEVGGEEQGWYLTATSSLMSGEVAFFKNNLFPNEKAVVVKSPYRYSFEYESLPLADQAEYKNIIFSFKEL